MCLDLFLVMLFCLLNMFLQLIKLLLLLYKE